MRIGELARRAGVGVQTIRYYERMHLVQAPKRMPSGYRSYQFEDLERVIFIRRTQELGFSLEEIRKLAAAHSAVLACTVSEKSSAPSLQIIVEMFETKRRGIAQQICELQRLDEQLRQGVTGLLSDVPQCPIGAPKAAEASCPRHAGALSRVRTLHP